MKFVTDLESGIVVDRDGLNKLKTAEMAAALSDIYGRGKQVLVVDNVRTFFGDANLFRALEGNAPGLTLILEKRGIGLDDEQKATLSAFIDLKAYITAQIVATTPPPAPYPFANVPDGWSIENNISVGKSSIRRTIGETGYTIGHKALQTVWDSASKHWARVDATPRGCFGGTIKASGYTEGIHIYNEYVDIGCQRIRRYELEQVALHLGWKVPVVAAD